MQLYIGIMSGTSLDGVDVALASFESLTAENTTCQLIATHFLPYPADLKLALLALHEPTPNELEASILLGNKLAVLYADAVKQLLKTANKKASDIAAIGCHGQTIRHKPELNFTLQIGNNALLAELTNISVVGDFRSRDIAAGGQGAPLVPAFHLAIFGSKKVNRAIINIGGIANITYLDKSSAVLGFDTGPGNALMDYWTKLHINQDYDKNGDWARTGELVGCVLDAMLTEPYFALPPPKSTGRDLFNPHWLQQHKLYPHLKLQDMARTLTMLTAQTIADAILTDAKDTDEIYICGGGAHNGLLIETLSDCLGGNAHIYKTDALGVGVDWVEAAAFAWLAKQTIENKPSNIPAVTGAKGLRVLGAIYPA